MQKYWNTVLDERGSPREGASVAVQQSGVNSTIYANQAGSLQKDNPLRTDNRGYFEFYAAAGEYDLVVSGTGFEDYEIEDGALVGMPSDDVTFTPSGSVPSEMATRTMESKGRDIVSVKDLKNAGGTSAVGDGVTSDTTSFTSLNNQNSGTAVLVPRTSASYLMGAVSATIPYMLWGNGKITLSGSTAGFKLNANMAGFKIRDIEAVGDAVTANLHKLIWNDGSKTISRVTVNGVNVSACVQNIDLSTVTDGFLYGNNIESAAGTASGQGYGAVMSGAKRIATFGNNFYANGRHSLYQSNVEYATDIGNIFYQHAGTGSSSAHAVSRDVKAMAIVGQVYAESAGQALNIDSDSSATTPMLNVLVANCLFHQNVGADIAIGASSPSATVNVKGVSVKGCQFYPTATRADGFIVATSGKVLDFSGNSFIADSGTVANYTAIGINSTAGATYYDRINVCNNSGTLVSSGGDTTFLSLGAEICEGTTVVCFYNNNVQADSLINFATDPPTNPNIKHDLTISRAVTLAAGSQTVNVAGYYYFVITGNAGASTITNFVNGYEGKRITLTFADANTTITRANAVLDGAANFTSSQYDVLELEFRTPYWYQVAPASLNG